jgi:DNA-binding MarR family transcriptional regulator
MANAEDLESVSATLVRGKDFSYLVAGMSRLLRGLARMQLFGTGNIGFAEWVALSLLAEKSSANNKALGRHMGVGGSRINELVSSLVAANLVEIDQSATTGLGEVRITEAGRAEIEAVNSQLELLLAEALKGKERTVIGASKQVRILLRVLRDGTSAGGGKKEV